MQLSDWLKLRSHTIPSVGEDAEHLEFSDAAGPGVNWFNHYGKLAESTKVEYLCDLWLYVPLSGTYQIEVWINVHQKACTIKSIAAYS